MMHAVQTETLPPVDPAQLESAYLSCAHLFEQTALDGTVNAEEILDLISIAHSSLEKDEIVDIFRRLCLTVQLLGDIDANSEDSDFSDVRSPQLPFAFFELASGETAFEETSDGYANTFFARDVLDDAFSTLRSH